MLRIGITVKNKRKKDEGEEEVSVKSWARLSDCTTTTTTKARGHRL